MVGRYGGELIYSNRVDLFNDRAGYQKLVL